MQSWIHNEEPAAAETDTENYAVVIHRENDEIVGLVCTAVYGFDCEEGPVSWIREVAVHPNYQNRGIAGKLILQAMNYGKRFGAVRAFLMADECNEHAIHLYEKLGFVAKKDDNQIDMLLNN
jgi:ribosomal protein S18 acetylase RimI-like enzyme